MLCWSPALPTAETSPYMAFPLSIPDLASTPIDRRDLAHDRRVWMIYAVVFLIVGISTALNPVIWPEIYDRARLWPFAAALLAVGVTAAFTKPPEIDDWRNHAVIVNVPLMSAIGIIVYAPSSIAPVAAALFAGTFSAGRLNDRRQLVAHYVVGTLLVVGATAVTGFDRDTTVAAAAVLPGIWVLGWATTLILEAAEAQSYELASLVRCDPLTGVGNRRLLHETLDAALPIHAAAGQQLTVLALDLNGFKDLNDRVGHDAGDALLVAVAAALTSVAGDDDVIVRQGGDEFCVLLPQAGPAEAAEVRAAIAAALAALGGGGTPVTTGIGMATFPADASTPDELLDVADARLAIDKTEHRAAPRSLATVLPMPSAPVLGGRTGESGSARVSRPQLAVNLTVWRAQGILITLYACLLAAIAVLALSPGDFQRSAYAFCIALAGIAYFTWRREPPAIGSFINHAVVALPYLAGTVFVTIAPSVASAAVGPLALAGALAGVRLVDRRQIVAHWAAATVCVLALMVSGIVSTPTTLGLLLVVLIIWGTGFGDIIYLERSEEQGEELERLVRRDPLTGIGNRRLLTEELEAERYRASRAGRSFSLLALDLNGFKALNDRLGHAAGDALLRDVADALTEIATGSQTVVRQGGDEFCIILPDTDERGAIPIANAARAAVARLSRDGHRITTGAGIATFPVYANTVDVLLYVADERLRDDKLSGAPRERRAESRPDVVPAPTSFEVIETPPDERLG